MFEVACGPSSCGTLVVPRRILHAQVIVDLVVANLNVFCFGLFVCWQVCLFVCASTGCVCEPSWKCRDAAIQAVLKLTDNPLRAGAPKQLRSGCTSSGNDGCNGGGGRQTNTYVVAHHCCDDGRDGCDISDDRRAIGRIDHEVLVEVVVE
jgi:hypothetical protein